MNKIIFTIGVATLCFGMKAMMHNRTSEEAELRRVRASQVTSAPCRDGLYEGKLATEHGGNRGVPRARWARQKDRAALAAGFQERCSTRHGQSRRIKAP